MDFTRGRRKSQSRSGWRNGATKPPLAASTWIGMSRPVSFWSASSASLISATGSYSPVKVEPRTGTTPMVFSSHRATAPAAFIA